MSRYDACFRRLRARGEKAFIPFFVIGGVLQTWQLLLRYKALRITHQLPWTKAFWATLLPFGLFLLFWLMVSVLVALLVAIVLGGR